MISEKIRYLMLSGSLLPFMFEFEVEIWKKMIKSISTDETRWPRFACLEMISGKNTLLNVFGVTFGLYGRIWGRNSKKMIRSNSADGMRSPDLRALRMISRKISYLTFSASLLPFMVELEVEIWKKWSASLLSFNLDCTWIASICVPWNNCRFKGEKGSDQRRKNEVNGWKWRSTIENLCQCRKKTINALKLWEGSDQYWKC